MTPFDEKLAWIEQQFSEIKNSAEVHLDLKYATKDNFLERNVYAGFDRCFLAPTAAKMFSEACAKLKADHPELKFKIWDALRPRSIQTIFFEHLKGTPFESYVAAPWPGSLHNFGMALDLTLQTKAGEELDMGTGFDDFRDLAQPALEDKFLATGELTAQQIKHRLLLRKLLEGVGFKVRPHEWWHFNALPKEKVHGVLPALD
jgi:D-alanyl-D-alanine dipeptidase